MKRRTLFFISVLTLLLCSCQLNDGLKLFQLERAIDKRGVVEGPSFSTSTPKVVTYFGKVDYLSNWLRYEMPADSLRSIAARYDDFEFLFYLRITSDEELDRAVKLVEKYGMEVPIYIDDEDKFRNRNVASRVMMITYIIDPNNKKYLSYGLSVKYLGFESSMRSAIEAMNEN